MCNLFFELIQVLQGHQNWERGTREPIIVALDRRTCPLCYALFFTTWNLSRELIGSDLGNYVGMFLVMEEKFHSCRMVFHRNAYTFFIQ